MEVAKKFDLIDNHNKSFLFNSTGNLLGYTISEGSIKLDPERLRPLKEISIPRDINSLRRVLGMSADYFQWIAKCSEKVSPLILVNNFSQPKTIDKAFEYLKAEVENAIVYSIDETIPFTVETYASYHGIGVSLNQSGRQVAFFSKTLNISKRKHSSIEKEAQAFAESLHKWRHYFTGCHVTLLTDQRSWHSCLIQNMLVRKKMIKIQM